RRLHADSVQDVHDRRRRCTDGLAAVHVRFADRPRRPLFSCRRACARPRSADRAEAAPVHRHDRLDGAGVARARIADMANRSLIRSACAACVVLVGGCAGWSTWDQERTVLVPERVVGADDYMVARGDTLYSIAFRNQLDYRQLARWNDIGASYLIYPGQVLRLKPPPGGVV